MPLNIQLAAVQSTMPTTEVQEESLAVSFNVQFWGVRAQVPTPGKDTVRYGGNTSCVEMRIGEARFIFDGGTGLRALGNSLLKQMPVEARLFFTHCHWDRIQGFPFFVPAFIPINYFHIYGAPASDGSSFKQRLSKQMLGPNFPVPIQVMQSKLEFHDLDVGSQQHFDGGLTVETCLLNEEQCSIGYRICDRQRTVVYAAAIEHAPEQPHPNLRHLANQADLLILAVPSAAYHPSDLDSATAADSPWRKHVELAQQVGVKQIVLSLHSPDHNDDFLDCVEASIRQTCPQASLAREGMAIAIA